MFEEVQASGGYLVSFHSHEEEDLVNALAPLTVTRLIGLIQPPGSSEPAGGWKWMSGEPFTYSHWGRGEPSNDGGVNLRGFENLVGIFPNGTWNDIHGGGKAYIIEYPKQLVIYSDLTNSVVSGYESVALRAGVASKRPQRFQWFANGRTLKGVTGNTLGVSAALKNPGPHFFTVSDGATTLTSAVAQVNFGPLFTTSPKNNSAHEGQAVRFEVSVSGPGPFSFQWYRNNSALPGETERFCRITNVTAAQTGRYWVKVSNANAKARCSWRTDRLKSYEPTHFAGRF
ncbi:MAG: immunoglobulin domain-containing protein [Verrucomicrobiales bacterium]|nr:immunoglobulin domain-containing protein [Verrucomicrobiales bacterium]